MRDHAICIERSEKSSNDSYSDTRDNPPFAPAAHPEEYSVSAAPEPERRTDMGRNQPPERLTRLQQLTLTTWRHASTRVARDVPPNDVLAQVAICAVQAILRDVVHPL